MWERQRRHLQGEKLRDIAITVYRLIYVLIWAAQLVKYWPAMLDTQVPSPDQEDPLEKEMATQSTILAWEIPWREEPGGLQPMGPQKLDTT